MEKILALLIIIVSAIVGYIYFNPNIINQVSEPQKVLLDFSSTLQSKDYTKIKTFINEDKLIDNQVKRLSGGNDLPFFNESIKSIAKANIEKYVLSQDFTKVSINSIPTIETNDNKFNTTIDTNQGKFKLHFEKTDKWLLVDIEKIN
jgi:transcriptional antiterminator